jgi:hypothetical protein
MLLSGASAAPTWSTSTIPTSAGASARKAVVSDGTNYVLSSATLPVSGDIVNKQIQKAAIDSTLAAAEELGDLLFARDKIFNVLDYGVISGDANSDEDGIQLAINAASAVGGGYAPGATVFIPSGEYKISHAITLKSYVTVLMANDASFTILGAPRRIFKFNEGSNLEEYVIGGRFYLNKNTSLLSDTLSNGQYAVACHFEKITCYHTKYMFDVKTSGDGWINGNFGSDFQYSGVGLLNTDAGFNGNLFSNVSFQTWADSTTTVFGSIYGSYNMFSNMMVWDFDNAAAGSHSGHLESTSAYTTIIGGGFTHIEPTYQYGFTDVGYLNYVVCNGAIVSKDRPTTSTGALSAGNGYQITAAMLSPTIIANIGTPIDITANPQIAAGNDGQKITIVGWGYALTLDDGTGLDLAGQCILGDDDTITLVYVSSAALWIEISRSNN